MSSDLFWRGIIRSEENTFRMVKQLLWMGLRGLKVLTRDRLAVGACLGYHIQQDGIHRLDLLEFHPRSITRLIIEWEAIPVWDHPLPLADTMIETCQDCPHYPWGQWMIDRGSIQLNVGTNIGNDFLLEAHLVGAAWGSFRQWDHPCQFVMQVENTRNLEGTVQAHRSHRHGVTMRLWLVENIRCLEFPYVMLRLITQRHHLTCMDRDTGATSHFRRRRHHRMKCQGNIHLLAVG